MFMVQDTFLKSTRVLELLAASAGQLPFLVVFPPSLSLQ